MGGLIYLITSRHGHEATVLALLKWGADINWVEMTKITAIHIAAYKNWAKIIDILITWPNIKYQNRN